MNAPTDTRARGRPRAQLLLLAGIFAAVTAVLAAGYFLFLRADYVVLAQNLRPADASLVVAELDKRGAAYRLRDGGGTILVPEDQADATRVAIAGSDAAAHGQIGFELFNKSDMGLTNFAQKINYQRALQGELMRTIAMMDGVESARVHLALPERALFRGDRSPPRAAVTVAMKPGQTADPSRVAGIQRLVAAAVPDLPETGVVVLDASGRVISPSAPATAAEDRPADLEERDAIASYFRARARGAVEQRLPGLKFALRALVLPPGAEAGAPAAPATGGWAPAGDAQQRDFRLRLVFVTEAPLAPQDEAAAREAMLHAIGSTGQGGDSVFFETGPVDPVAPPAPPATAAVPPAADPSVPPAAATEAPAGPEWPGYWPWALLAIGLVPLGWWLLRPRRALLKPEEHEAFAGALRRGLNLSGEGPDAVA